MPQWGNGLTKVPGFPPVKLDSHRPQKSLKAANALVRIGNRERGLRNRSGPYRPLASHAASHGPLDVQEPLKVPFVNTHRALSPLQPPHKVPSGSQKAPLGIVIKVKEQGPEAIEVFLGTLGQFKC